VQQAIRYTTGIVGENYGPDLRFDFLTLRGFTPKQYIDGLQVPITTTIFNVGLDLYGFQEVDVLKGPASVLYGNAPPGGIYNLTSRRADTTFGGEVGVRVGSDDYRQLHGSVTGALTDTLSGRVTALVRERGSQMDFVEANRTNTGDTNGSVPASVRATSVNRPAACAAHSMRTCSTASRPRSTTPSCATTSTTGASPSTPATCSTRNMWVDVRRSPTASTARAGSSWRR